MSQRPITDAAGVKDVQRYLTYIKDEAKKLELLNESHQFELKDSVISAFLPASCRSM